MKAMVEPLPLVPATWITGGSRARGWPSASRMRHIRSSERSISFGCSAVSRATMESTEVMSRAIIPRNEARTATVRRRWRSRGEDYALAGSRTASRRRLERLRRRLGQQPAQIGQRRAQLVAMHHHVHHAVLPEIFGALEAVRQLLADGLLDHARTGKADERAGLRDMHVAEHRVGGGDAAGGRIGEHDDVGLARLAQHLHRDGGARQLHQRQDPLLHARAARGREHDEGRALVDRGLQALDHAPRPPPCRASRP